MRPIEVSTLQTTDTSAVSALIGGGITAGTGTVALVTTTGKLASINSTYIATITSNSAGKILRSDGTNFINSTATYPGTTTANQILYSSASNVIGEITTAANSVLITSSGSAPSLSQTLPSQVQANITGTGTLTSGSTAAGFTLAFNLSTMTGIVPSANGGTNNAFVSISGPATSVKTYTLNNSTTTIVTTADTSIVTNAMLAGSIAASKLVGTDITTVGTITSGVWNAGAVTSSGDVKTAGNVYLNSGSNSTGLSYGGGDTGQVIIKGGGTTSATFGASSITLAPAVTCTGLFTLGSPSATATTFSSVAGDLAAAGNISIDGNVNLTTVASNTGTALGVVGVSSGGHTTNRVILNTSSRRFKENIFPVTVGVEASASDQGWSVSRAALRRFVQLDPSGWDYIGKPNGAFGFISEDLAALPIANQYGRSPLINYDIYGRPESNRDFALIGLQHLVLQDHEARIAELEAELSELKSQRMH